MHPQFGMKEMCFSHAQKHPKSEQEKIIFEVTTSVGGHASKEILKAAVQII